MSDLVINEKTALEILKGKPLGSNGKTITSRAMFADMRTKSRFHSALGNSACEVLMSHFNIADEKGHVRRDMLKFLNGKTSEIIIDSGHQSKRSKLDMSFDESLDGNLDVSMASQQSEADEIADLRRQLKESQEELRRKDEGMSLMGENYRAKVRELQSEIKQLKNEASNINNVFGRKKQYNEFLPAMKCISIKCLSYGMSARHLNYCLEEVAHALDLPDNVVPSDRTLRDWRQNLIPGYNQDLINDWIKSVDSFSMLMDCTSMSGASKISAIGLAECGNEANCIVIDFYPSTARTGPELFEQIKKRIERQPLKEMIFRKTKNLMSDQGSTQVRANKLLVEYFNGSDFRQNIAPLFIVYCGMHTVINVDSRLCRNMMKESNDAFILHQLLKRYIFINLLTNALKMDCLTRHLRSANF